MDNGHWVSSWIWTICKVPGCHASQIRLLVRGQVFEVDGVFVTTSEVDTSMYDLHMRQFHKEALCAG